MQFTLIGLNKDYQVFITTNKTNSLCSLKQGDKNICESFNKYAFIEKVKQYVKLTKKQEREILENSK